MSVRCRPCFQSLEHLRNTAAVGIPVLPRQFHTAFSSQPHPRPQFHSIILLSLHQPSHSRTDRFCFLLWGLSSEIGVVATLFVSFLLVVCVVVERYGRFAFTQGRRRSLRPYILLSARSEHFRRCQLTNPVGKRTNERSQSSLREPNWTQGVSEARRSISCFFLVNLR